MNEFVKRWIEKARNDIKAAKILINSDEPPTDVICFHAQQAVEKLLKAYLTHKGIRTGKTHDIAFLLKLCIREDRDFTSLESEKLESLTFYAVEVRYPDDFYIPTTDEAKNAIDQAEKLLRFILKKIGGE